MLRFQPLPLVQPNPDATTKCFRGCGEEFKSRRDYKKHLMTCDGTPKEQKPEEFKPIPVEPSGVNLIPPSPDPLPDPPPTASKEKKKKGEST